MINTKQDNPHLFRAPEAKIVKGRTEFVVDKCRNKKVLHLGCVDEGLTEDRVTSGSLLHLQLMGVSEHLWGLDISPDGLRHLKGLGIRNLILGDAEHLEAIEELKGRQFDIILASEIIEHLDNAGIFLNSVKSLFSSDTEMILTTPNAFSFTRFRCAFKKYEYVHPDHNYWFSWKTLSTLLLKHGYLVKEILVYDIDEFKESLFQKVIKNIFRTTANDKKMSKYSDVEQAPTLGDRVRQFINFPIEKYFIKRNPFFANGLIFIVTLSESVASEQPIKK
jgi:hypothetical protein